MFEWVVPYLVQGNPNRQAMFLQCRGALSLPHRRQIYLMHHNRMLPRMAYQTWPHWTQTIQLIEIHTLRSTVLHNNTTVFIFFDLLQPWTLDEFPSIGRSIFCWDILKMFESEANSVVGGELFLCSCQHSSAISWCWNAVRRKFQIQFVAQIDSLTFAYIKLEAILAYIILKTHYHE